jgi:hypothetical protein
MRCKKPKKSHARATSACIIDSEKKIGEQTIFFDGFLIKFQKKSHTNNDRRQLFSQKNFFFFFFGNFFFGTAIVRRPYKFINI